MNLAAQNLLYEQLRLACLAARMRLNDESLSTCVKAGKIQVVRVTYNKKGRSTVVPVSEYLPVVDAITFLNTL